MSMVSHQARNIPPSSHQWCNRGITVVEIFYGLKIPLGYSIQLFKNHGGAAQFRVNFRNSKKFKIFYRKQIVFETDFNLNEHPKLTKITNRIVNSEIYFLVQKAIKVDAC